MLWSSTGEVEKRVRVVLSSKLGGSSTYPVSVAKPMHVLACLPSLAHAANANRSPQTVVEVGNRQQRSGKTNECLSLISTLKAGRQAGQTPRVRARVYSERLLGH